ncbi:hypothetical protein K8T06_10550 [bacterium]|nr:hypothetical protein [bacterium]
MDSRKNARICVDAEGNRVPTVFGIVKTAMEIIIACGEDAVAEHGQATLQFLEYACCQAVSSAFDPNLFRMTNQFFYDYVENYSGRSRK